MPAYLTRKVTPEEKAELAEMEMKARRQRFRDSLGNNDHWGYVARNNAHGTTYRKRIVPMPAKGFFVGVGGC